MWRGIPKQTPLPFLRSMTKIRLPRMRSTALHGRFPIRLLAEPAIPLYTNLDSETFLIGTIKELYRLRWGIETSFRELKYTIGLSCLHGKKTDFLLQEVFARLILYNYASLIARKIPVPQEKQINFTTLQIYNHYNTIDLGVVRLATNYSIFRNFLYFWPRHHVSKLSWQILLPSEMRG